MLSETLNILNELQNSGVQFKSHNDELAQEIIFVNYTSSFTLETFLCDQLKEEF